eukprot:TRINITY_DN20419_c0_g2_i1.p1 TRINITY_DN20419_c0_g2~~TRINITY_DN20419_c0_g2_i1.p1  ORF type:complete len:374 (-),score=56.99 TRINITY_DN20419_c0_g2_i1:673-1794(-)
MQLDCVIVCGGVGEKSGHYFLSACRAYLKAKSHGNFSTVFLFGPTTKVSDSTDPDQAPPRDALRYFYREKEYHLNVATEGSIAALLQRQTNTEIKEWCTNALDLARAGECLPLEAMTDILLAREPADRRRLYVLINGGSRCIEITPASLGLQADDVVIVAACAGPTWRFRRKEARNKLTDAGTAPWNVLSAKDMTCGFGVAESPSADLIPEKITTGNIGSYFVECLLWCDTLAKMKQMWETEATWSNFDSAGKKMPARHTCPLYVYGYGDSIQHALTQFGPPMLPRSFNLSQVVIFNHAAASELDFIIYSAYGSSHAEVAQASPGSVTLSNQLERLLGEYNIDYDFEFVELLAGYIEEHRLDINELQKELENL